MIRISDRHLPFVKELLDIEDDDDRLTIHHSPSCELPPYILYIKVRDVFFPVTAIVMPMDGSTIEIDTWDGSVTVVALPDDNRDFMDTLRNPPWSPRSGRRTGWRRWEGDGHETTSNDH